MSRIGKMPIPLPKGVSAKIEPFQVEVKGPKGTLTVPILDIISVSEEAGVLTVARVNNSQPVRAKHGLYRALIANAVKGVSDGFSRTLYPAGVGYKAEAFVKGGILLNVGFSHPVAVMPPPGITFAVGTNNRTLLSGGAEYTTTITITGADKAMVGQMAAKIRNIKPPEPYKGKGIRYSDETVRHKAGKTAGK